MTHWYRWVARLLQARTTAFVAVATLVWLVLFSWSRPLLLPDEGRYVGVAWNMLYTGNWAVPLLDGLPFFHKPPLFYWLTALSLQVFGVHEWAARLGSALATTLMVTLTFWFLKKHVSRQLAAVTAIILAAQPFLFGAANYANLDMTVAGIIAATVLLAASAVLRYEGGQPYRRLVVLAYAVAGLGFLAKGLIGIVLPGGVVLFWLVGRRRWNSLLRLLSLPGLVVLLLVCLPWMWLMQARYSGFFDYYILYQHFYRFLESGFNNPRPFWFYVPVLLAVVLPWSLQLLRLAGKAGRSHLGYGPVDGLMLTWLVVVVGFFSIPTSKLLGYVLPAAPPLAYFIARLFAGRMNGVDGERAGRGYAHALLVSLGICLAAVVALVAVPRPSSQQLAQAMRAQYHDDTDDIIMLGRLRYDLGFYLGTGKPAAVVADWEAPDLMQTDNWRKEMFEAGRFDPQRAAQLLLNPRDLPARICAARTGALWLVGDEDSAQAYPQALAGWEPAVKAGGLAAWRLEPGAPLPPICGETPRSGLK